VGKMYLSVILTFYPENQERNEFERIIERLSLSSWRKR
jgi:hypothetical protein